MERTPAVQAFVPLIKLYAEMQGNNRGVGFDTEIFMINSDSMQTSINARPGNRA